MEFLKKVFCVTLEEGFERGQGCLMWPSYEPSRNCREDDKEMKKWRVDKQNDSIERQKRKTA